MAGTEEEPIDDGSNLEELSPMKVRFQITTQITALQRKAASMLVFREKNERRA